MENDTLKCTCVCLYGVRTPIWTRDDSPNILQVSYVQRPIADRENLHVGLLQGL